VFTLEAHDDKCWALSVGPEPKSGGGPPVRAITGGGDSTLVLWEDCTQIVESQKKKDDEEKVLIEQKLDNSLAKKDYHKALLLAFALGHRGKALEIIDAILVLRGEDDGFRKGQERLVAVVRLLTEEQIGKCLLYIRDWNAIGKYSPIAQQLLHAILQVYPLSKLTEMSPKVIDLPQILQGIIPYTEKHFNRIDRLIQASFIIDYTIKSISNNGLNTTDLMDIKE